MTDHTARIQALVATIRATMQPCPLCGTAAYAVWVVNGEQMFKVGCASCGLELKAAWYRDCSAPTKDIAALWNSRVAAPTPETPSPSTALYMANVIDMCCDELISLAAAPDKFPAREAKITATLRMAAREFSKLAGAVSHPQPDPRTTTNDDEVARGDRRGSSVGFGTAGSDAGAQNDSAEPK